MKTSTYRAPAEGPAEKLDRGAIYAVCRWCKHCKPATGEFYALFPRDFEGEMFRKWIGRSTFRSVFPDAVSVFGEDFWSVPLLMKGPRCTARCPIDPVTGLPVEAVDAEMGECARKNADGQCSDFAPTLRTRLFRRLPILPEDKP